MIEIERGNRNLPVKEAERKNPDWEEDEILVEQKERER